MKNKALPVFFFAFLLFLFVPVLHSSAAGLVPCGLKGGTPCTLCHLIVGIKNIVDWLIKIAVTAALTGITISGVMYVISTGDPGMMQTAKNFLKACIIGFILTLGAWLIVSLTMWLIAAQTDLGISKKWNEFDCTGAGSTSSSSTDSSSSSSMMTAPDSYPT